MITFPDLENTFKQFQHITIDKKKLHSFAAKLIKINETFNANSLLSFASDMTIEERLQLSFLFNTQTFYFWTLPGEEKWTIDFEGNEYDGSVALAKCFERSIRSSHSIFNTEYYANMTITQTHEFFKGNVDIPLLAMRKQQFNEAGIILREKYEGQFINAVRESNFNALKLLELIVNDFPYFNDHVYYQGRLLNFYKRAQLQVVMTHNLLIDTEFKGLADLDQLTGCADYKLPQILRHFGVLNYDSYLSNIVDNYELIYEGSDEEIEIRVSMLFSLKLLSQELKKHKDYTSPIFLDGKLWRMSQTEKNMKPYHRTPTINY